MMKYRIALMMASIFILGFMPVADASEEDTTLTKEQLVQKRMDYYIQHENILLPWYYLAAVDQFERNIQEVRKDIPKRESVIAIQF